MHVTLRTEETNKQKRKFFTGCILFCNLVSLKKIFTLKFSLFPATFKYSLTKRKFYQIVDIFKTVKSPVGSLLPPRAKPNLKNYLEEDKSFKLASLPQPLKFSKER